MKHPISEIIIHCSANTMEPAGKRTARQRFNVLRDYHMNVRGWRDIGYHWYIDITGEVIKGRTGTGAHVMGHNRGTIGICLWGGRGGTATDNIEDNFTQEQITALIDLVHTLQSEYGDVKVSGHNQYANKACPTFNVPAWWASVSGIPVVAAMQANNGYPTLRAGMRGIFVKELQIKLRDKGYPVGNIDGHFGKLTKQALLGFQAEQELVADGIAGVKTWRALQEVEAARPQRAVSMTDLRERGSSTVKTADAGQIGSVIAVAAGAVAAVKPALDLAQEAQIALTAVKTVAAVNPVAAALGVGGIGAFFLFRNIKKARLNDARSYRNLGR